MRLRELVVHLPLHPDTLPHLNVVIQSSKDVSGCYEAERISCHPALSRPVGDPILNPSTPFAANIWISVKDSGTEETSKGTNGKWSVPRLSAFHLRTGNQEVEVETWTMSRVIGNQVDSSMQGGMQSYIGFSCGDLNVLSWFAEMWKIGLSRLSVLDWDSLAPEKRHLSASFSRLVESFDWWMNESRVHFPQWWNLANKGPQ